MMRLQACKEELQKELTAFHIERNVHMDASLIVFEGRREDGRFEQNIVIYAYSEYFRYHRAVSVYIRELSCLPLLLATGKTRTAWFIVLRKGGAALEDHLQQRGLVDGKGHFVKAKIDRTLLLASNATKALMLLHRSGLVHRGLHHKGSVTVGTNDRIVFNYVDCGSDQAGQQEDLAALKRKLLQSNAEPNQNGKRYLGGAFKTRELERVLQLDYQEPFEFAHHVKLIRNLRPVLSLGRLQRFSLSVQRRPMYWAVMTVAIVILIGLSVSEWQGYRNRLLVAEKERSITELHTILSQNLINEDLSSNASSLFLGITEEVRTARAFPSAIKDSLLLRAARFQIDLGLYKEAEDLLGRSDSENEDEKLLRALLSRENGDLEVAQAIYEELAQTEGSPATLAKKNLIEVYIATGDTRKAARMLEGMENASATDLLLYKAKVYGTLVLTDPAYIDSTLSILDGLLNLPDSPEKAEVLNEYGLALDAIDVEKAEQSFLEAIQINNRYLGKGNNDATVNYINLGGMMNEAGHHDKAVEYLERAEDNLDVHFSGNYERHPYFADLLLIRCQSMEYTSTDEDALLCYEELIRVTQFAYGTEHSHLGVVYHSLASYQRYLDKVEECVSNYQLALKHHLKTEPFDWSRYGRSAYGLGLAFKTLGQWRESIERFREAFEIYHQHKEPKGWDLDLAILLAESYKELGQTDSVESWKNKAKLLEQEVEG